MTSPFHLRSSALLLLLLAAACGSGEAGTAGTGGAGAAGGTGGAGAAAPEPAHHRPSADACTSPRPAGNQGDPNGACQLDTDCTMGENGRCIANIGGSECSYDECASDADCGNASVCKCRIPDTTEANVCFHGNCLVDADCGAGGYCSPSAVDIGPSCSQGISPGSVGYFCHTPDDDCVDDAECPGMFEAGACIFQVEAQRWSCFALMCVD